MKLYLHIGIEKTGTSSIQSFLNKNREQILENYGILYPKTGIWFDKSHHGFAFSVTGSNLHIKEPENFDDMLNQLEEEIKENKPSAVLISSEIFRGLHQTDFFDLFNEKIQKHFDEVILIVFLRDQPYWLLSMYNQYIKDQNIRFSKSFDEFYSVIKNKADYYEMLKNWNKYIEKENMYIFPYYERNNELRKSSIDVICDFLNINTQDMNFDKSRNISLNRVHMEFYRFFNRLDIGKEERNQINSLILNNFNDEKYDYLVDQYCVLSIQEKVDIQNDFYEINKKVSQYYMNNKELFPPIKEREDKVDYNFLNPINFSKLLINSVKKLASKAL